MKRLLIWLTLLCVMLPSAACAIGRALPSDGTGAGQSALELTSMIGRSEEEYKQFLSENGKDGGGVRAICRSGVITGFYLSEEGYSLYGYAIGDRCSPDLKEDMLAQGWTATVNQFEGGLRFQTYQKADGDTIYELRRNSCDLIITAVSLEVSGLPAVVQAEQESEKAAEKEADALALYNTAVQYQYGREREKDLAQALQYYLLAADAGYAEAATDAGYLYFRGQGTEQNFEEAIRLFKRGYEMGDSSGAYYLATMYNQGEGVEQSYEDALAWYTRAVELGDGQSACYIGYLYLAGHGVEQSNEEALKWYRISADMGSYRGKYALGEAYYKGEIVEQDLHEAEKWLLLAAEYKITGAIKLLNTVQEALQE